MFTEEEWQAVLDRIVEGNSLRQICRDLGITPAPVIRWIAKSDERGQQYARAQDERADSLAEEIDELARRAVAEPALANGIRVAIDAKKWIASKLKPKRYGDKIDANISGSVGVKFSVSGLDDGKEGK